MARISQLKDLHVLNLEMNKERIQPREQLIRVSPQELSTQLGTPIPVRPDLVVTGVPPQVFRRIPERLEPDCGA